MRQCSLSSPVVRRKYVLSSQLCHAWIVWAVPGLIRVSDAVRQAGLVLRLEGAQGQVRDFLQLIQATLDTAPPPPPPPRQAGVFEAMGAAVFAAVAEAKNILALGIDTVYWGILAPCMGEGFRWRTLVEELAAIGVRATFLVVGLLQPSAGAIRYWGRDVVTMEEDERAKLLKNIGIAFQSGGLFNSLTVAENIALPLVEHGGFDAETIQALVRMKLSLVGLADAGHVLPGELSGGMKKRAGVA
jgi:ABC transporter family protein